MMKDKKTILFVNGHLNVGGVERALVDLLSWLDYERYDVDLLLTQGRGDYEIRVPYKVRIIERNTRQMEGPFFEVVASNFLKCRFSNVCYRVIQLVASKFGSHILSYLHFFLPVRSRYDIAIAFRHDHCAEIVSYAIKAKHKYCWWHHGEVNLSDNQISHIVSLWNCFNKIVTVSEGCKRMLQRRFVVNPSRIIVIPNLIDYDYVDTNAGEISPYLNESRKVIVSISRLSPEKHLDNAVAAAQYMIDNGFEDFVWYIIGDGDCEDDIKKLIVSAGLKEHFVLKGKMINPYPFLKYADIFVHPSYVESQGIAVLEAMSLGVPVVAVRSIGTESFMVDGENGLLVDKGVRALAEGVLSMFNMDVAQIRSITSNARDIVKDLYGPSIVMKAVNGLFDCESNT